MDADGVRDDALGANVVGEGTVGANVVGAGVVGDGKVWLCERPEGLTLTDGTIELRGDFSRLASRLRNGRVQTELLVKAAKVKGVENPLAIDATAGLGEDALLLAAAGFRVCLYERDGVIAALLRDALTRAGEQRPGGPGGPDEPGGLGSLDDLGEPSEPDSLGEPNVPVSADEAALAQAAARMELFEEDSIAALGRLPERPDVVLLDPMFPARQKSAAVKKKFQLLHHLELPCADEQELLEAAIAAGPRKVVIKRPPKGPYLAGRKPSYSLSGKAVRYDVIALAQD